MKGRIFSGIQPSGSLHLGNYLGAIRNWVRLQGDYEAIYCVVDLHAITQPQDPKVLRERTIEVAASFVAAGLDVEKTTIFAQSHVAAHSQLAWIFNCVTPLGWLNRMTQFKDKAGKKKDQAVAGLYTYPVLMAADILLYKATHVPVGDDQKQHVELARDIAGAFNRKYEIDFFPLSEPVIQDEAARIMSLRDGAKKMSSSDPSDQSRINLIDDADAIAQKIRRAKSDSVLGLSYDPDERPEASNLLQIYAALAEEPRAKVEAEFAETSFADFKGRLADLAVSRLDPITSEMRRLMDDRGEIEAILKRGAEKAEAIASDNIAKVYDIVGFLPR
ncbi:MAG: tryptophan--tRNA ligase [Alphaproteobacteria bacterium]|nr:tryptophan--tRNA ligase [Alphaproteobacteria bacterium]